MAKTPSRVSKSKKVVELRANSPLPTPSGPSRVGAFKEVAFSRYNRWVLDQEFLPELIGKSAIAVYREMRLNEPVIRGIMFIIESLMRSRDWTVEPFNESPEAMRHAEFVREALEDMGRPLDSVIVDIQNAFIDGFSWSEIVWKVCKGASDVPAKNSLFDDGRIGIHKIVSRSPSCLEEFKTFDDTDDLSAATFRLPPFDRDLITLPLQGKSFHFRPSAHLDDPYGTSLLRGAYKPYFYKKGFEGFEAIAIERDLAGFITLKAPEGYNLWSTEDPAMVTLYNHAVNFIMSIRNNEISGAAIPFGWELDVKKGGGERQINIEDVITRLENRMGTVVAGDFIIMGQESNSSRALAEVKWDTFCTAVMGFCRLFAREFRTQVLRSLIGANKMRGFDPKLTPHLVPSEIKKGEFGEFSAFINALGNSGLNWSSDKGLVKGVLDRAGIKPFDMANLIRSSTGVEKTSTDTKVKKTKISVDRRK